MRLTDDYDKNNEVRTGLPVVYMAIGAFTFFIVLICIVLSMNYNQKSPNTSEQVLSVSVSDNDSQELTEEEKIISELGQSTLQSEDLDFWNMYKKDEESDEDIDGDAVDKSKLTKSERYEENARELMEAEKEEDLSEGGTKTMITFPDGTEQWIMINSNIPKNNYDYTGLVLQEPIMRYYDQGAKASFMGITVNDKLGEIDFEAVKRAGVDFAMIEIASRGYETGVISYDDKYYENLRKATEAGLDVGVIFCSQAVNETEAEEEAQVMLDNIVDFTITYPIVFQLESVNSESCRTKDLTKLNLTGITMAFCKKIAASGFTPMIMANKYWLLRKLDLTLLSNYDIWLNMCGDIPDYPYQFAMWQYAMDGKIDGINGDTSLSICFIDYSKR